MTTPRLAPADKVNSDWTEKKIEWLRVLWSEGHSTAEIGRLMSITKNAVVGKAHRVGLPPRSSPITRGGPPREKRAPRAPKSTLPLLKSAIRESRERVTGTPFERGQKFFSAYSFHHKTDNGKMAAAMQNADVPRTAWEYAPTVPRRHAPSPPTSDKCRFPLWGHHERPTHQFCDAPAVRGAFCARCAAVCYVMHASAEAA